MNSFSDDIIQGRTPISNYVFEDGDIDLDDDSDNESSTSDNELQLLATKNSILNVTMLHEMSKNSPIPTPATRGKTVQYQDEIHKKIPILDQNITLGVGATSETIEYLLPRDVSFNANNDVDVVGFYKDLMHSSFEPDIIDKDIVARYKNKHNVKQIDFIPEGNIFVFIYIYPFNISIYLYISS
jgi:hypothetical protein